MEWVLGDLGCKIATGGICTPNASAFTVHTFQIFFEFTNLVGVDFR